MDTTSQIRAFSVQGMLSRAPKLRDRYIEHVCREHDVERLVELPPHELAALERKLMAMGEDATHLWLMYQCEQLGLEDRPPLGLDVGRRPRHKRQLPVGLHRGPSRASRVTVEVDESGRVELELDDALEVARQIVLMVRARDGATSDWTVAQDCAHRLEGLIERVRARRLAK